MKNKAFKLLTIILAILITVSNGTVLFASATECDSSIVYVPSRINPIYEGIFDEPENYTHPIYYTRRYFTSAPSNVDYKEDYTQIADELRETMRERKSSVTVYYKTQDLITDGNKEFLYDLVLADAFKETDLSNEGDYLWLSLHTYPELTVTQNNTDGGYYYYKLDFSNLNYYTTKEQETTLATEVAKVIESFGFGSETTDRQKIDAIYGYITENIQYDHDNFNNNPQYMLMYTAYAALINKTAVCQGYATLFYYIAKECGIDTRIITGQSREENHAWNIAKVGNYYYYLDSTWDAGAFVNYNYYLKGSSEFYEHTNEDKFNSPEFTSKYPIAETGIEDEGTFSGTVGNFEYTVSNSFAKITKYLGDEKNVIIPSTVDGYPVKVIGEHAIQEKYTMESLEISEGIVWLEFEAILQVFALKKISLPSTLRFGYEEWGDAALGGYSTVPQACSEIETVILNDKNPHLKMVDGIIYSADMKTLLFAPKKAAKQKLVVPNGVESIAPSSLCDCVNIKEIVLPNSIKCIGYWGISGAANLEKINIPEGCEMIGQFALAGTKLKEIHIPSTVETLMGTAFGADTNLEKITVSENNEYYYVENGALIVKEYIENEGEPAYWYRAILDYETANTNTVFEVPDNINCIQQYAFSHANNLKTIKIPNSVETIWNYAFENNQGITHISIPNSVKDLPFGIFSRCDNLASVLIPSSVETVDDIFGYHNGPTVYCEAGSAVDIAADNYAWPKKAINEFNTNCANGHNLKYTLFDDGMRYCDVCTVCGDRNAIKEKYNISAAEIKFESIYVPYTGKEIKPPFSVTWFDNELVESVDYKLVGYSQNKYVGSAEVKIQGIGDYGGFAIGYFNIVEKPTTLTALKATVFGGNDVKLTWEPCENASGYEVYYKKSTSNTWTVDTTNETSYKIYNLSQNTKYDFKVLAYCTYETQTIRGNSKSTSCYIVPNLSAPSKVSASLYGYDDVKVSWSKVSNAKGYKVYYKTSSEKSYKYKGTTTKTYMNFANLSDGVKYYFKVVPCTYVNKTYLADDSYKTTSIYTLKKVSKPKVAKYKSGKVKISWTNISGESGYQISKSTSKTKTGTIYTYSTTTGKSKVISAKKGRTYYYKVRTYKTVGKKKIYGPWSSVKAYKLK